MFRVLDRQVSSSPYRCVVGKIAGNANKPVNRFYLFIASFEGIVLTNADLPIFSPYHFYVVLTILDSSKRTAAADSIDSYVTKQLCEMLQLDS